MYWKIIMSHEVYILKIKKHSTKKKKLNQKGLKCEKQPKGLSRMRVSREAMTWTLDWTCPGSDPREEEAGAPQCELHQME